MILQGKDIMDSELQKGGGPAFPGEAIAQCGSGATAIYFKGMTLRDWFAGQTLTVIHGEARREGELQEASAQMAERAYVVADAMLKERAK